MTPHNTNAALLRSRSSRLDFYALSSVILLGLAVRLWELAGYGIWFDEAYHVALVRLPTVGAMLDAVLSNPPSDPLYVLLLRPWVELFGHSEVAIRSISVIFSTSTIGAVFWLGSVLFSRSAGLVAALFLALSPYVIELGQEAALYALASLTTTLALAAGWRWRNTGSKRDGWVYVASGIVAAYSHYVPLAILALFAILAILPWAGPHKVTLRAWALGHVAILLAWLPWLIGLVIHWLNAEVSRATLRQPVTLSELESAFTQLVGALTQFTSGTSALLRGVRPLELAGLLLGGTCTLLGWLASKSPDRRGLRVILLLFATIFFVPALLSAVINLWLFVPHFMLFLLPALFVAMAGGLVSSREIFTHHASRFTLHASRFTLHASRFTLHASRFTLHALLAAWTIVQLAGLVLYYRHPPHGADGLRELAARVKRDLQPGDGMLVTPPILTPTLRYYYDGPLYGLPTDFDLRAVYLPYVPDQWQAGLQSRFSAIAPGYKRFWLVYRSEWDAGGSFLSSVKGRYKEVAHRSYQFAELYLFEP